MFTVGVVLNVKYQKQPKCQLIKQWVNKLCFVNIKEYYASNEEGKGERKIHKMNVFLRYYCNKLLNNMYNMISFILRLYMYTYMYVLYICVCT